MRHLVNLIAPAGIMAAGLFFSAATSWAVPEFARKTKKECSFCHPPDSWQLTEAGKYYRAHKYSLEGYKPKTPDKQAQHNEGK